MKSFPHLLISTSLLLLSCINANAQKLSITSYSTGLSSPIDIKNCGDNRLFIANRTGIINVINSDGTLRPTPFLDLSSIIDTSTTEEGLLGLTFSPNYKTDGKFFVNYLGTIGSQATTFISQYKVSAADSNVADPSSAITLLTRAQYTGFDLGGNLMFGKDGYLYINLGDGGGPTTSQDKTSFFGKILRVDISNSSVSQPYIIPSSNPLYNDNTVGLKKEIWAYGVRNPWRNSVDRITGDLWLSDVGQNRYEEINFQPSGDVGGHNYGWDIVEGDSCYSPSTGCEFSGITLPVYVYPHPTGLAIIGGYVYRSAQSKSLFGTYIFADFIGKFIDGLKANNGTITDTIELLNAAQQTIGLPQSFGEDMYGDQYIVFNGNSTVYKISDSSSTRRPKAYITPIQQNGGTSYLVEGLQGINLTYQWLKNNTVIAGATSPDYTVTTAGVYSLVVTNSLGFSDTSDVFPFGSLSVNLISFAAQKVGTGKVAMQWKIGSEQNTKGYVIQRKQNNETTFSNIGFVASKSLNGNSSKEVDYSFEDLAASNNSQIFYRLQIQNNNGSVSYSDIKLINVTIGTVSYSFYPNPSKDQVQVYIDGYTKPVVMIIYNNNGQKVKEQILSQETTEVKLAGLKGIYFVELSGLDGKNSVRKKLLVE